MRVYTVYLKYDDVEDFNAFNANSEEEAIAIWNTRHAGEDGDIFTEG